MPWRPWADSRYRTALAIWVALSTALYFAAVTLAVRRSRTVRQYAGIALLGAAGFPPFWYLLQHGQLSAVALCIVVAAFWLLCDGRAVAAAAVLGLLIYKPPLFAPMVCVLLLAREWKKSAVMLSVGLVEVLAAGLWVGAQGLRDYLGLLLDLPRLAPVLAVKPYQMHSLRAFWLLIVPNAAAAAVLYAVSAALAVFCAAQAWRRAEAPALRMSALVLGTALASPHLYIYDLVILAPVWVWLADWFLEEALPVWFGRALYVGFVALLMGPFAQFVPFQLSVVCLGYLLVVLWACSRSTGSPLQPSGSEPLRSGKATGAPA